MEGLPVMEGFISFQLETTSSQERSSLILYRTGSLGFLVPARRPRYLKPTISPALGCHLDTNSVVPGVAVNRTPFGLNTSRE